MSNTVSTYKKACRLQSHHKPFYHLWVKTFDLWCFSSKRCSLFPPSGPWLRPLLTRYLTFNDSINSAINLYLKKDFFPKWKAFLSKDRNVCVCMLVFPAHNKYYIFFVLPALLGEASDGVVPWTGAQHGLPVSRARVLGVYGQRSRHLRALLQGRREMLHDACRHLRIGRRIPRATLWRQRAPWGEIEEEKKTMQVPASEMATYFDWTLPTRT